MPPYIDGPGEHKRAQGQLLARVSRSMDNAVVVPCVLGCSVPQALSILEATGLTNVNLTKQSEDEARCRSVTGQRIQVSPKTEIRLTIA